MISTASSVVALALALLLHPAAFTARTTGCAALPSNIQVEPDLRPTIARMLVRSRTLRGQCRRIAASPSTHVSITIWVAPMQAGARAVSLARRYESGLLVVDVRIPPASRDFAELLAHELEHVTELIDGIDYRSLATARGAGIARIQSDGSFESDRAHDAGVAAAAEVAARTDSDSRLWGTVARFARAAVRR